jgi:hypothetical protein
MARRLFTIEDTFLITGSGLVPVPGIVPQGDERFRVGDPILLKRPDGSCLQWKIGGLEMISCTPPRPRDDVVILLQGLSKEDVPVGSEVWSVDRAYPHATADPAPPQHLS